MVRKQNLKFFGKAATDKTKTRIGRCLIDQGLINKDQLNDSLKKQEKAGELLGVILVQQGFVTEEDVAKAIADSYNLPYINFDKTEVDENVLDVIPPAIIQRHDVLPFKVDGNKIHLACDRPPSIQVTGNLRKLTGKQIVLHIAATSDLQKTLSEVMISDNTNTFTMSTHMTNPILADLADDESTMENSVISLLDDILEKALRERASDIHFESGKMRFRMRFRVDGILRDIETYPPELSSPLVSRIKILAGMNIAEKRAPQDGGFTFERESGDVDIRASTLPTIYGEKAVLRLLTTGKQKIDFGSLGMEPDTMKTYGALLKRPHGLILMSGPTGSGKSTALYASLLTLKSEEVNITTVEDPVEYKIDGISQVQVNIARKVTFANALRSILRQDPDIIMIGEVRDRETAEIAIQASLTGHLVLATIHTNDAPNALTRLIEFGCEPYLVSSAVIGVIAQRLVRLNCANCSKNFRPSAAELSSLGYHGIVGNKIWSRGDGCRRCDKTGYSGRIGIFEFMRMTKEIKQEVIKRSSSDIIREVSIKHNMRGLVEDGLLKVNRRQTTPEEVLRVTVLE